jgi:hypothetical protein
MSVAAPAGDGGDCASATSLPGPSERKAIDANGTVVDPTEELPAYAGHFTCAIERGPVSR